MLPKYCFVESIVVWRSCGKGEKKFQTSRVQMPDACFFGGNLLQNESKSLGDFFIAGISSDFCIY
jgi:hypothetical protein